jgi:hypothetical protein
MKWPTLAPAVKSTIAPQSATSVAIDMLGCLMMSPATTPRTTRNGSTPFLKPRTASPFFAASMAHQITTVRRANSDGCRCSGPRFTQRRAPFTTGEMARVKGRIGMRSSSTVTPRMGHAYFCQTW